MTDVQVTVGLPILKKGAGPGTIPNAVGRLQQMLNDRGSVPQLTVDGDFGPMTESSVKHFQQNENLTVDGVVGQRTWTTLLSGWILQSEPG